MTELTDLSDTDASNTAVSGQSTEGNVANMGGMDNLFQATLGMLSRFRNSNVFRLRDNSDNTKLLAFDLSGLTTATTTTLKMPNVTGGSLSTLPRGYLYGLTLSNNVTDANNDIDVAAGEAASDVALPALIALASAMTKRTDAAWAVGSGNGGWLDGAAMPNGVGHVFLMQRSDTGVVDVGISASATAPVLPANYDRKRRIGAIIRDSGALLGFKQMGNTWLLTTPFNDGTPGSNPGAAATLYAMKVPTGIQVTALGLAYLQSTDANRRAMIITSPDQTAVAPAAGTMSSFVAGLTATSGNASGPFSERTNTSGQIRFQLDGSSAATSLFFTTRGWVDEI